MENEFDFDSWEVSSSWQEEIHGEDKRDLYDKARVKSRSKYKSPVKKTKPKKERPKKERPKKEKSKKEKSKKEKHRKEIKEDYDDYEDYEDFNQYDDYSDYDDETLQEIENKAKRKSLSVVIIFSFVAFWAIVLVLGAFTTDFENGKAYVVDIELREEREYLEYVMPYYETLMAVPAEVEKYKAESESLTVFQNSMIELNTIIVNFENNEQGIEEVPTSMQQFHQQILDTSMLARNYINAEVEYKQNENTSTYKNVVKASNEYLASLEILEEQMIDLQEYVERNIY